MSGGDVRVRMLQATYALRALCRSSNGERQQRGEGAMQAFVAKGVALRQRARERRLVACGVEKVMPQARVYGA